MIKKSHFLFLVLLWLFIFNSSLTNAAQTVPADFTFCDTGYKPLTRMFTIFANKWEEKEICWRFSTSSETPVEITYWLSMWTFNQNWVQVCDQDMTDNNEFSKLFTNQDWNVKVFTITNTQPKEIKEKIRIPLSASWMIYGCVTYKGKQATRADWKIFDIVMRKAVKLNIFAWWNADIKSSIKLLSNKWKVFSSNNKIKADLTKDNRLNLGFLIQNAGNVGQEISITWTIYNALWFEKQFTVPSQKLAWWKQSDFQTNIWVIPTYKWFFDIAITVSSTPTFDFDSTNIDAKFKQTATIEETWKIFIFSRLRVIAGILALLIIYLILRPMFKKHKQ